MVRVVSWLLAVATAALAVTLPLVSRGRAALLPVLLLTIPFALLHAWRRYGRTALLVLVVAALVVSNVFENLSIATGFPFGRYHYEFGPKLVEVPVYIGPIYFGLGYVCWQVASALLGRADAGLGRPGAAGRRIDVVALPALAAVLMTVSDLGRDSVASTVSHAWTWQDGGGVFGVPYTNYLGWWLCTYVFFQIFAIHLYRRRRPLPPGSAARAPLGQSVLIYAALGAASVPRFVTSPDTVVVDPAGAVWNGRALDETMMVVNLFGPVALALLAGVILSRAEPVTGDPTSAV